jgi:hypothetical protein
MKNLIEKLSKIQWYSLTENRKGFISQDKDWKVFYTVDIDQSEHSESRFYVTVYVRYKDAAVTSYGCNLVEQNMFADWFLSEEYKIRDREYDFNQTNSDIGKKLFK